MSSLGSESSGERERESRPEAGRLALVVTADDFGLGPATSAGIIRAHLQGPVTATSLMVVTGDRAAASVPLLARAPGLEVGLHLVLTGTGEKPLRAGRRSGLVGNDGRFLPLPHLLLRAMTGQVCRSAVLEEIAAQAERFVRLLGRPPAYVDGHHHSHQLPVVRDALMEATRAGVVPPLNRTTRVLPGTWRRDPKTRLRQAVAHHLGGAARQALGPAQAWSNDWFFGMLSDDDWRDPFPWRADLGWLPAVGVVEWVVHPGLPDESWAGRDPYVEKRVAELVALTDPVCRGVWEPWRVNLSTKAALVANESTGEQGWGHRSAPSPFNRV